MYHADKNTRKLSPPVFPYIYVCIYIFYTRPCVSHCILLKQSSALCLLAHFLYCYLYLCLLMPYAVYSHRCSDPVVYQGSLSLLTRSVQRNTRCHILILCLNDVSSNPEWLTADWAVRGTGREVFFWDSTWSLIYKLSHSVEATYNTTKMCIWVIPDSSRQFIY